MIVLGNNNLMATKKSYPAMRVTFPEGTDTRTLKNNLADIAQALGYIATYHKTVDRGSVALLLQAIANGEAVVTRLDDK